MEYVCTRRHLLLSDLAPSCLKIVAQQLIIMLSNTAALRRAICLEFHFLINDQANLESVRNHPVLEFGEIHEATWTRNLRTNPDLPYRILCVD